MEYVKSDKIASLVIVKRDGSPVNTVHLLLREPDVRVYMKISLIIDGLLVKLLNSIQA
jgi:hypothetical protein